MRLTKLELHGFKSFADSTTFVFEPGVTAIVGPNGCGKSNVSDAVRWVLGEQSARTLRGAKMDEVIFQGSSARRPVSVAEASLHFDNDDGTLPVGYREVVVTRRLSRSGESEYLLNRAPCRLRDIHDLMRGTGLGADAGVVIESRMIDALLSDRPDDRRELFEEAAGIGLYRDRRRTTERRLEETSIDLARLDDLLAEVQTQVRSLARQRRRAERHAELTTRRFSVDLTLATRDLEASRAEIAALDAAVRDLGVRLPQCEDVATASERRRDDAHRERAAAEGRRAELARIVATLHQQLAALQADIAVAAERQQNAQARRQRADDERRDSESVGGRVLADRDAAATERRLAEAAVADATEALAAVVAREESARQALSDARQSAEQRDRHVRELRDAVAHLNIERASAEREHGDVLQRLATLATDWSALADRESGAHSDADAAGEAAQAAASEAGLAVTQSANVHAEALQARHTESEAHRVLARAEAALAELDATVQALERLDRERVGLAPAAATLLRDRDQFGDGAVLGPLSDFLTAGTADAAVIEQYLGATVHAVVVRDRAAAEAVRRWHTTADPGPLCLLPLDAVGALVAGGAFVADGSPNAATTTTPTARASGLASRVAPTAHTRGWARTLLEGVLDLGGGSAFEDARGAIWLPGTPAGQGPLRRRAELAALRESRQSAFSERESVAGAAAATRAALADAQVRAAAAAESAAAAEQRARLAHEHHAEGTRHLERVRREQRQNEELTDSLTTRAGTLADRIAALVRDAERTEAAVGDRERASGVARTALGGAERAQEETRESRTVAQVALAQVQARAQLATERERRLGEEYEAAAGRLEALRAELQSLAHADGELAQQVAAWRADLATRQAGVGDAESRLRAAEAAVIAADTELLAADQALDSARLEGTALAGELHRVELRRSELSGRQQTARERLEAEWRRPWESMVAELVPLETESEILRVESDDLQSQLGELGPVNVLAIEEHGEELKRFEFLTTQRADLASGQASLQQAIREIDTTARALFLETFGNVRENFRRIFMMLFGGGECDLRLENPDTPMDCDIEIHASPRGKRTQRIHLLSSGERALVALSLLFGIFLTKPSPFCLLDEVDAPLDDQNIGRFVRMLNEFKAKTQFIIITHNPRTTTEAADAVYGVTMQEPGVSSVVSVRLTRPTPAAVLDDSAVRPQPALQEA